jgi:hypothetical protein
MSPGIDKERKGSRTASQHLIEYVSGSHEANETYKGITVNLGKSGICVIVFRPHNKGDEIVIKRGLRVSGPGTVKWVKKLDKDVYKVGLIFDT